MKSIWYFVGLLLVIMGVIITISAVHSIISPTGQSKILSELHPDFWWGILMLVFGLVFALLNRRKLDW